MNYKVLYRKYRPDNFDSLVGQKHVVDILKNSIIENRIAHAYLFSGPRGTGKTSTARIFAKAINCLNNSNGQACMNCEVCTNFNNNPDIIEIDAASNNGVDEIRELINNVKIMPTSLKYKVYIIDEVHMLSQSAFNALLLTLEEPPEHVIFILATTNIESVPITILSRTQRFDFHRITDEDIFNRLVYICKEEGIEYDDDGLKEISVLADGGLRDALSILDQLSKNKEIISVDLVSREVGSISNKQINKLVECLDKLDIKGIEKIFKDIENTNLNYKVLIKKIVYKLSEISVSLLEDSSNYRISFDDVKNLILELNDIINKINISINPYLLIKLLFLSYIAKSIDGKKVIEENYSSNKVEDKADNTVEIKKDDSFQIAKENEKVNNKKTRINNCFVDATKMELNIIKPIWNDFIKEAEEGFIKGLISDTIPTTASNKYAIIVSQIPHKDEEIMNNIKLIEDKFLEFSNKDLKLVFISEEEWLIVKEEYIKNLKNGYKYEYISEEEDKNNIKDDIDMSGVADVFDINKIEIE